ncbi:unnamed protein product [Mesocestoides corti]|uniref:Carbohydrate deacetylase n=1 Tax=Mesocestoides corti TaxID=53468 RepID=A0A0R3UIA4_MESCO|nr:unnamed protein product [Mesocestoides corti]
MTSLKLLDLAIHGRNLADITLPPELNFTIRLLLGYFLGNFFPPSWLLNPYLHQALSLAIVGDDGFYAERRDAGLVECLRQGHLTDVSVLMNGGVVRTSPRLLSAVLIDHCRQESFLPGLHVNITEGEPVCPKHIVSTLVDRTTGLFFGKSGLRKRVQSINPRHTEIEIERQLIAFEKVFGAHPLRVDGHQHCHILPGIVDVLCRLLPRHGVSWIRLPEEAVLKHSNSREMVSCMNLDNPQTVMDFFREVSEQSAVARAQFQASGLK